MISKADSKFINNHQLKKYRQQYNSFIVEGKKNIEELLHSSLNILKLYLTPNALDSLEGALSDQIEVIVEDKSQIEKISSLMSNSFGVALVEKPEARVPKEREELVVALDRIQDPGNLGTIIRACDWYKVDTIVRSSYPLGESTLPLVVFSAGIS